MLEYLQILGQEVYKIVFLQNRILLKCVLLEVL